MSDTDYPTAEDCRQLAETCWWLAMRTDAHEGTDDRARYQTLAKKLARVVVLLEANPNYFTTHTTLRAA